MRKKNHQPGPVPRGNRPHTGPDYAPAGEEVPENQPDAGAPPQDQDAKRRLGGFEGAGEHARQQPGALNDGDRHSR